ncbi:MAG: GNAT family N-acetyltransferase [Oscillospiraceae bacterium]|nr:GNAT family N-acetyltransferase [Oscillospiraceae bacterium]
MNIEIKKLIPELTEDYLHFFDVTPHDDDIPGSKCYCVCWCSADHRIATDFSSQEKRRELARQYIKDGVIQGYLAYQGERVIGWCNANTKAECQHCISWLRFMQSVDVDDTNLKIKSVFCFVIVPDMQRKGIATKLLCRVCEDAAADGFDVVESYPNKAFVSTTRDFMGPVEMYKKLGFTVVYEVKDIAVMRKCLKEN